MVILSKTRPPESSDQGQTDSKTLEQTAHGSQKTYVYDKQSKAFFLTLNNPSDYGYTHDGIIDIVHSRFKNRIYWCMCDEQGSCYHTHVYLLLSKKKRWSAVQKAFQHGHIEQDTKGSPQECRAYIKKEGSKFSKEKVETNFPDTFYEEGDIPDFFISNDRAEMLQQLHAMIEDGLKPEQIFEKSLVFRQFESIVRKQFFAKRFSETPPVRDIKVTWHLGLSGSGKSYSYVKLCEEHGADNVYYASDFSNACTALLDTYEAQPYLFIDEVKADSFRYSYLLQLLQGYRTPIHARYSNVYSLWKQVDITSIYEPHDIYEHMVNVCNRSVDSEYQLLRRITHYVYHWKTDDGNYHTYEMDSKDYVSYDDIRTRATGEISGFIQTDNSENPFESQ